MIDDDHTPIIYNPEEYWKKKQEE